MRLKGLLVLVVEDEPSNRELLVEILKFCGADVIAADSVAGAMELLQASRVLGEHPEGLARVLEGLMTGIGFIGGGAILKSDGSVRGTATAASVWNTGASAWSQGRPSRSAAARSTSMR
jgi:CheY-like chemotaxis protein